MIERKNKRTAKIGIFAVAHNTYFSQFEGLYEKLLGYHEDFCNIVTENDAEIIALCAPRRLQIDVGKTDSVFDYIPSIEEGKRAAQFYTQFNAEDNFRFNLWDGGHRFDESGTGFDFFFDGI